MLLRSFGAVLAVFATSVVSQTYTSCNPTNKTCDPAPALGNKKIDCDFTKGECSAFTASDGTTVTYDDNGALFSIENKTQSPTLSTSRYFFFGRVEVILKGAAGQGVITSVVLQSADLDEIDWEWIGGSDKEVETNYFGKGDTTTYDRAQYHDVTTPLSTYHNYTIEWTSAKIDWIIDGTTVRTLNYADAQSGARYPQTPMQLKIGTWVAGLSTNSDGTVEWAGGLTDFSKAPFKAWYKSVSVVDYAGGNSAPTDSIKQYVYGDKSGSYGSIEVVKGASISDSDLKNNNEVSVATTDSASAATSATSTSSKGSSSSKTGSSSATTETGSQASKNTSGAHATTVSLAGLLFLSLAFLDY